MSDPLNRIQNRKKANDKVPNSRFGFVREQALAKYATCWLLIFYIQPSADVLNS